MGLSDRDHIGLIRDILKAHHLDGAASQSEYEQLYRTTKRLLDGHRAGQADAATLQAIHDYSAKAIPLSAYDEHLSENKSNLETWINRLDAFV
ncbi:YtzH-like family protein [Caenibacillus caldisaponilyticus]|jgi:hypothetical protein|uniref:YtzH-like family protein n=1 Tax=Caenibacillus caldisaponilyticus TaxID=1674942 RepID=UPI000988804A|nr:YtzH-like family protein [Caenibacillus caldisaponilyticus]